MSQKIIISDFIEGVNSDKDVLRIKNTQLRDSLNTVVVTIDGKGVVRTPIPGFTYEFELTPGFKPMGAAQFNGILYIISKNDNTGFAEIGSYPSPRRAVPTASNFPSQVPCPTGTPTDPVIFEHNYKPFNNFTGTTNPVNNSSAFRFRENFTTKLLKVDCPNQIDMEIRDSFDGSVNIYFADGKNPLRDINSGFNQLGECNSQYYWNGSFPSGVETFGETKKPLKAELDSVSTNGGGSLQAGMHFFYFRYLTEQLNSTSFVSWCGPIEIYDEADTLGSKVDGAPGLFVTNKSCVMHLTNIDTSYRYIQVANYYQYNNGEERYTLLDKRWDIDSTGDQYITILGDEKPLEFSFEALIQVRNTDDIPKSITQLENQLWMGNLKNRPTYDPRLVAWANTIRPKYDDSLQLEDRAADTDNSLQSYRKWDTANKYTGYFRGETYCFGVICVYESGRRSPPIPIKSVNAFDPATLAFDTVQNGIYQFPNTYASNPYTPKAANNGEGFINVMGIKFDVSDLLPPINTQTDPSDPAGDPFIINTAPYIGDTFVRDNIAGFIFVRAKRKPLMEYQGVALACLDASALVVSTSYSGITWEATTHFPAWDTLFPETQMLSDGTIDLNFANATAEKVGKFGLYSTDQYFNEVFKDNPRYVIRNSVFTQYTSGGIPAFQGRATNVWAPAKPSLIYDTRFTRYADFLDPLTKSYGKMEMNYISKWEKTAKNDFVSYYTEAFEDNHAFSFLYQGQATGTRVYNRAMASPTYLSMDQLHGNSSPLSDLDFRPTLNSPAAPSPISGDPGEDLKYSILSVYTISPIPPHINTPSGPAGIFQWNTWYIPQNEKFYEISPFIAKEDFITTCQSTVFYHGDCFIQRSYHQALLDPIYGDDPAFNDAQSPGHNGMFGVWHGIITENAVNHAMRMEGGRLYYPKTSYWDIDILLNAKNYEAEALNKGYNKVLPATFQFGVNQNVANQLSVQKFSTRIRFSNKHLHNGIADGYRQMDIRDFKDFDYSNGEITAIEVLGGLLVSIQESAINIHLINERAAITTQDSQSILLGQGDILSPKVRTITNEVGSQHQWSILRVLGGLTGVDAFRRKIWLLENTGKFRIISDELDYQSMVHSIIDSGSSYHPTVNVWIPHSDLTHKIADSAMCDVGIHTGYDIRTGDIFYTFILTDSKSTQRPPEKIKVTIGYNERLQQFIGRFGFAPGKYVNINDDLFSIESNDGVIWRQGQPLDLNGNPNYANFYGVQQEASIEWIVNEKPELTKVFDNLNVTASEDTPLSIRFATEDQELTYNPFIQNNLAHDGRYMESQWRIPIGTSQIVNSNQTIGSSMRGKWLSILLKWKTAKQFYAKGSILFNRISKR